MSNSSNKRGFALPMALLVMVVLTAGIAAGFSATSAEILTNAAHRSDNRAYIIAQAGLEQYLARRNETGFCTNCLADPAAATADSEWTRVVITGGYADVKAVRLRKYINDTLPALYFIRSNGVDTSIRLTGASGSVYAQRTVGVYATWTTAVVDVQGAWLALSGLQKNGNAGLISGVDQCSAAQGGGKPTLAGAVVPTGQFSGDTTPFTGSPPIDRSKTLDELRATSKINWPAMLNMSYDFEVGPDAFPDDDWFADHPTAYPVIRVHSNDFQLPNAGRGMIIADSNFRISGSNMWDGIVLVGGKLTSNGNNTTSGATMSGLNLLLGGQPEASSDDSDANGQKTYVYNSCSVDKASKGLRSYRAITNTYFDSVPVW